MLGSSSRTAERPTGDVRNDGRFAEDAGVTVAQFLTIVPLPGTLDFDKWEAGMKSDMPHVNGIPSRAIGSSRNMSARGRSSRIRSCPPRRSAGGFQMVWDRFYSVGAIWRRSDCVPGLRGRLAFVPDFQVVSTDVREHGLATDSARVIVRWGGRAGWPSHVSGCLPDRRCPTCRFRRRADTRSKLASSQSERQSCCLWLSVPADPLDLAGPLSNEIPRTRRARLSGAGADGQRLVVNTTRTDRPGCAGKDIVARAVAGTPTSIPSGTRRSIVNVSRPWPKYPLAASS